MEELTTQTISESTKKKKLWNKDFILLLQGSVVSTLGDLMYSVAIGFWVYSETGSSGLMGVMTAISMFVTMILSPFTGSIIDKCNRKWVLVGMDLLQSAIMITVGILAYTNKLNVPVVLVAAFLASFGTVFYNPAASTLMIDIIPHDDMVRGQSLFQGASSFINLVGSAFSGVMITVLGVPLIIIINGLSNLYSAISELFINVPKTVNQGAPVTVKGIVRDFSSSIKFIFSDVHLKVFIPCMLIINLLAAGPFSLIMPFIMEKGFNVDMYGYIMSLWTASSLICVLLLGVIKLTPKMRFWTMTIGFCGMVLFLVLAYLSTSFVTMCIFAFIGAFMNMAGNTIFNASFILAIPEENRGAILGFVQAASVGGSAISTVIYGFLGDIFPLYIVFTIGTIISLIPMIYLCFYPKTKEFILSH